MSTWVDEIVVSRRGATTHRFIEVDGTSQPLPRRPVTTDQVVMRLVNGAKADQRRRREFDELGPADVVPW
jgi:hypothetical protein